MEIETKGEYGGLGIRISLSPDGYILIITPFPGTPAFEAGILPGDKIIKIEDKDIKGITLEEAVKKLRGEPGTEVKITILHEGEKEPKDIKLTRAKIKIPTLYKKMYENNIGYIKLNELNKHTLRDLKQALVELKSQGMEKLILDLRYNPGGLLDVAVDVASLFLGERKLIVYTQGRIPESNRKFYSNAKAPFENIPMVVLINKGSASGSEIIAGALQDHKKAIIIGTKSFGKASVQSIYKLYSGCALKLTTAKYYTPSGKCIERDTETGEGGIAPDIEVEVDPELEKELRKQEGIFYPPEKQKEEMKELKDPVIEKALEIFKIHDLLLKPKG
jgi:carboxyl-terminal processing protease